MVLLSVFAHSLYKGVEIGHDELFHDSLKRSKGHREMQTFPRAPTRSLTIIAQDPSVRDKKGNILRAHIRIPNERLFPGPLGHRVKVVDYDVSSKKLYKPLLKGLEGDPFAAASDEELLSNPQFHSQNVYAIVMRILARFEFALGRRVSWSFRGHQLHVVPHAFADANAFYSKKDWGLFFGYFRADGKVVFSCLSHDVVAHETTHALVDGLRERYTDPSSPDQAGFHEGFADIVALLSVFSLKEVVPTLLGRRSRSSRSTISRSDLTLARLQDSVLVGLAEEMGQALSTVRGDALRKSVRLKPSAAYFKLEEFEEPHRRGEVLVAAVLNTFLEIWLRRLKPLLDLHGGEIRRERVVEEGSSAADHLLTMCIRALDYTPPTNIEFGDFLSALLTADREIQPDDSKYDYRKTLRRVFQSYGIVPASRGADGIWEPPEGDLDYTETHFESMQRDPDEVFRFAWENRIVLGLCEDAFSRVLSVRPCMRVSPDGFYLRETVADYLQILTVDASELRSLKITKPPDMPDWTSITLYGGGALLFDEYGRLKYHVRNSILNPERQSRRLGYLWKYGFFGADSAALQEFSALHRSRMLGVPPSAPEEW